MMYADQKPGSPPTQVFLSGSGPVTVSLGPSASPKLYRMFSALNKEGD